MSKAQLRYVGGLCMRDEVHVYMESRLWDRSHVLNRLCRLVAILYALILYA